VTRIALIHALAHSVAPINDALAREMPLAMRMNLLDDSLSADLAASANGLDAAMHDRFARLGQYAVDCGCDAILFTCSAFGPCIEAVARAHPALPVLKPNQAMIAQAASLGCRIGLIASFAPTLQSMPAEFPANSELASELVADALVALNAGDTARHDALVVAAAERLVNQGCAVIALAQFSMARARKLVAERTGLPVLTTVDSAVIELRRRLGTA
jgi:Asp/Glu/hydantoin racemase